MLASGLVALDLDYEALDLYLSLGFVPAHGHRFAAFASWRPAPRSSSRTGASANSGTGNTPTGPRRAAPALEEYAEELLELLRRRCATAS